MTGRSLLAALATCAALFAGMAGATGVSVWRDVNKQPPSGLVNTEVNFLYYQQLPEHSYAVVSRDGKLQRLINDYNLERDLLRGDRILMGWRKAYPEENTAADWVVQLEKLHDGAVSRFRTARGLIAVEWLGIELNEPERQQVLQAVEYLIAAAPNDEIKQALSKQASLSVTVSRYGRTDVDGLRVEVCEVLVDSQQILEQLVYLPASDSLQRYDIEMDEMQPLSLPPL